MTFAASDLSSSPPYSSHLLKAGIEVLSSPFTSSIEDHLRDKGELYNAVILSRADVAEKYVGIVRQYAPQALLLFDTVDLHFLRQYREAKLTGNIHQLKAALHRRKQELAVAAQADYTLVVSPVEKTILEKECPGIRVHVISSAHEVYGSVRPFSDRKDILFIGGFGFTYSPNIDAMIYFVNEIYPLVRKEIVGLKIYIIGSSPPSSIKRLSADDVIITGHVPDVAPYLNNCKLSIAPIRFGAGIKGKVLMSMSYGVPVVASSVASEGMDLVAGRDLLVADSPRDFSEAVVNLYYNKGLWEMLSRNGLAKISQHFSFEAVRAQLVGLLPGCE